MAIGLATFLPSSDGAVPCGASAIAAVGLRSSSSDNNTDSAPAMDPEHSEYEVAETVAVAVERGE